jgi:hypothetical protein
MVVERYLHGEAAKTKDRSGSGYGVAYVHSLREMEFALAIDRPMKTKSVNDLPPVCNNRDVVSGFHSRSAPVIICKNADYTAFIFA